MFTKKDVFRLKKNLKENDVIKRLFAERRLTVDIKKDHPLYEITNDMLVNSWI